MKILITSFRSIAPTAPRMASGIVGAFLLAVAPAIAQPFNINSTSRETVRVFFNTVYQASEVVPINWIGNSSTATPTVAVPPKSEGKK